MVFFPPLLIFTFAVLHIFGAVGWLALNTIFAFGLDGRITQMPEGWQQEFRARVFPNLHLQYKVYSGMTSLFGTLFAFAFAGGDLGYFSLANPIGSRITIGGTIGLFAWLLGNTPYFRKLKLTFNRLNLGGLEFYVLVVAFLYMVAAAHPYV